MDIYVGNINYKTTEEDLRSLFEQYGMVASTTIPVDRNSGHPRGFGFVSMQDPGEAEAAIEALDRMEWMGKRLRVNKAFPRRPQRNIEKP